MSRLDQPARADTGKSPCPLAANLLAVILGFGVILAAVLVGVFFLFRPVTPVLGQIAEPALWGLDEAAVPPETAFGCRRVHRWDPLRSGCGSGGCYWEADLILPPGVSVVEFAQANQLPINDCAPVSPENRRIACTYINFRGVSNTALTASLSFSAKPN